MQGDGVWVLVEVEKENSSLRLPHPPFCGAGEIFLQIH